MSSKHADSRSFSDPVAESIGGHFGHWFRRTIHICLMLIPWAYYWHGDSVAGQLNRIWDLGWTPQRIVASIVIGLLIYEAIRLRWQLPIPGHRRYELNQISSLAWGAVSIAVAMLVAPTDAAHPAAYGLPLVMALSLVDPLMGEMRRAGLGDWPSMAAGLGLTAVIWAGCALALGTPWLLVLLAPPVTVAAERADLGWMDDNAAMIFAPLAWVLILHPWL